MNPANDDVAAFRRFAADVLAAAPRIERDLPPELGGRIRSIVALAHQLNTRSHDRISIGVAGEYTAGKSALLSVLVGEPDLLRVSNVPTTANVTSIRLNPIPAGAKPRPATYHISMLAEHELNSMIAFLLGRIVELIDRNRLVYPVELLSNYDPLRDSWQRFNRFGSAVWPDPVLNATLKLGIAELARIRDALVVGHQLIPRGSGSLIAIDSADTIRGAVEIGRGRELQAEFPAPLSAFPLPADTSFTAAQLASIQPLIRRVTVGIDLRQQTWPLGQLPAGCEVELLDFPGLNSQGGARDQFLSELELGRVSGLLVAVSADRPETDAVLTLTTELERVRRSRAQLRDSILAVATKFDVMPRRDTDLEFWSESFASLHRTTRTITHDVPSRVSFVSSLVALRKQGLPAPPSLPAVDPALLEESCRHWAQVADRLPPEETGTAAALREYAIDGGIDGLRKRLADYVVGHGVDVHFTEMRGAAAQIRKELTDLDTIIGSRHPGNRMAPTGVLATLPADLTAATQSARRRLLDLRDLQALGSAVDEPLGTMVRDRIAAHVSPWPQWWTLLERVGPDSSVPFTEIARGNDQPNDAPRWTPGADEALTADRLFGGGLRQAIRRDDRAVPDVTTAFLDPFRSALEFTAQQVDDLLARAFRSWVETASQDAKELADTLARPEVLDAITAGVGGDPAQGRLAHTYLVQLTRFEFVGFHLAEVLGRLPRPVAEDLFPLPMDRALPWHPRHADRDQANRTERHQSAVARIRRDMIRVLDGLARSRAATVLQLLPPRLTDTLDDIAACIPDHDMVRPTVGTGIADGTVRPASALIQQLLAPGTDRQANGR